MARRRKRTYKNFQPGVAPTTPPAASHPHADTRGDAENEDTTSASVTPVRRSHAPESATADDTTPQKRGIATHVVTPAFSDHDNAQIVMPHAGSSPSSAADGLRETVEIAADAWEAQASGVSDNDSASGNVDGGAAETTEGVREASRVRWSDHVAVAHDGAPVFASSAPGDTASLADAAASSSSSSSSDLEVAHAHSSSEAVVLPEVPRISLAELSAMSVDELSSSQLVFNRELSELKFYWRVLYEAMDTTAPLLERVKFLAITASNIDGYVGKRVGNLTKILDEERRMARELGEGFSPQLEPVHEFIDELQLTMAEVWHDSILPELASHGFFLREMSELEAEAEDDPDAAAAIEELADVFEYDVRPLLCPVAIDARHPFPKNIRNLSICLAALIRDERNGSVRFVLVQVPDTVARYVRFETPAGAHSYVRSEDLIGFFLPRMFPSATVAHVDVFRVTRDFFIDDLSADPEDVLSLMTYGVDKRRYAAVVRLEVAEDVNQEVLDMLCFHFALEDISIYTLKTEHLIGMADMFFFMRLPLPAIKYRPWTPVPHPWKHTLGATSGDDGVSPANCHEIFDCLRERDIFIQFPFVSFESTVLTFVASAAIDPAVRSIKMTLYRLSSKDPISAALIRAARAGKDVTVVIELKASYDEARNLAYAAALEEAGCTVTYGIGGMKTHAKIIRVVRDEPDGLRIYSLFSTGNFNETTAALYIDMAFMTSDPDLGREVSAVFDYLTGYGGLVGGFRHLLVSPFTSLKGMVKMIRNETKNAREGKRAAFIARLNGLTDKTVVKAIYEAAEAGVQIDLLVRGMCRLRPGIPGKSDNIRIISYVGRFLEHSRIYCFYNAGQPRYFLGSADLMTRNLKFRVEVIAPVRDPEIQKAIRAELKMYLSDERTIAWDMLPDGRYKRRSAPNGSNRMGVWGLMMDTVEANDRKHRAASLHKVRTPRDWDDGEGALQGH